MLGSGEMAIGARRRAMTAITVRTITLGIGAPHPLTAVTLGRASAFLRKAQAAMEQAGYLVQTTRIATRPLLTDLADWDDAAIVGYAAQLQTLCDAEGIAFCSLGPAPANAPEFPLERLALLPEMLVPHSALNATVQLASGEPGGPFFPQAYHRGETRTVSVGLQGAGIVRAALESLVERVGPGAAMLPHARAAVTEALAKAATPVVDLVRDLAARARYG